MTDETERPAPIDAHVHVWDLAVRDQPWTAGLPALRRSFPLDELRPSLRDHDMAGAVVVQTVCVEEETPELLALADADPDVAGVVGWVDLQAVDVAEQLDRLRTLPGGTALVGIRHQVQDEPDPHWLHRAEVRRGLRAVAAAGLAYDLVVRPVQLPAVISTVRAVPELRFVLDHGGKPAIASGALAPWRAAVSLLAAEPNIAVKLSGLATEADQAHWTSQDLRAYSDVLLARFGPRRTMYGSDWPVCLLAGRYDAIHAAAVELTASLSAADRAAVFGGSATDWYRLGRRAA